MQKLAGLRHRGVGRQRLMVAPVPVTRDQPPVFVRRLALRFGTMNLAFSAFILLPLILYTVGALLVSFFVGFGFRKGWDFRDRWPRQRP